jgi:hypothetical protein
MSQNPEELFNELGIDTEYSEVQQDSVAVTETDSEAGVDAEPEVEMESIVQERVIDYHPGLGRIESIEHTQVLADDTQIVTIVNPRPRCPNCDHLVMDLDEEAFPAKCGWESCVAWTCSSCGSECEACDTLLCSDHRYGHGTKDQPYCRDCVGDVEEQVRHERELERQHQDHTERMDELEHQRVQKKQEAELEEQSRDKQYKRQLNGKEFELKLLETLLREQDQENDRSLGGQQPDFFEGVQNTVDSIKKGMR